VPTFIYTAKSQDGEEKSGAVEAVSEHELAMHLRQEGYFLTSARLAGLVEHKMQFWKNILSVFNHVSLAEKMIFAKHLSTMVKAGLPLNKSLRILCEQTKNKYFKKVLNDVEEGITRGQSFSDSLQNFPNVFSVVFISMVRVGETAGNLEDILKNLSLQMEKDHELRSRVRGAMVYPSVILSVMVVIGILMMIMVVPKLSSVFGEMGAQLPLTTRVVISVSQFLSSHSVTGIVGLAVFIFLLRMLLKTAPGKKTLDTIVLKTPLFSQFSRKINSARFARNFSSLIEAGVPIYNALQIVSNTMSNSFFKECLAETSQQIQKGETLSNILKRHSNLFPIMVVQMIEVGETTGSLAEVLKNLAEFYENEVDNATKNLSSVIEPVLMVIIGVAVGFFAISMIQPMYSMIGQM
jgi:type IV pilus assembly protein PilC